MKNYASGRRLAAGGPSNKSAARDRIHEDRRNSRLGCVEFSSRSVGQLNTVARACPSEKSRPTALVEGSFALALF